MTPKGQYTKFGQRGRGFKKETSFILPSLRSSLRPSQTPFPTLVIIFCFHSYEVVYTDSMITDSLERCASLKQDAGEPHIPELRPPSPPSIIPS